MIVGVLVLLASLPVWFPWVLQPMAARYGVAFAHYHRVGYTQFAVEELRGQWAGARLDAQRVVCVLPTTWLWRKWQGETSVGPHLAIQEGQLLITGKPAAAKQGSLDSTLNQTIRVARTLERVLPAVQLTNCTIQVASNRLSIPHAVWGGGRLAATLQPAAIPGAIVLAARTTESSSVQIQAAWNEADSSVRGEFHKLGTGWRWNGEAIWQTNRAELAAEFTSEGWWPVTARLNCPELKVPASVIHLRGYQEVSAALVVQVSSNQFSLQATGLAKPTDEFTAKGVPALDFSFTADGDPDAVNVRKLRVQSPWLRVDLTNSVGLTWRGELLASPAQFFVAIDLSHLPGEALTGRAEGVVRVTPHGIRPPSAQFELTAESIHAWRVDAAKVRAKGEFASPALQLDELLAEWVDGSKLAARGALDLNTREIAGGEWHCSGGFLKALLPGLSYDALSGSGQVRGPLTNLAHQGEITIQGLRVPQWKPLNAVANWSGQNLRLESGDVELAGGASILTIAGEADLSGRAQLKAAATLRKVALRRGEVELFALQRPCSVSFHADGTNASSRLWTLTADEFAWRGSNRAVFLTAWLEWPTAGKVTAAVTNLALADFSDFLTADLPDLSLARLAATARWSNGPVHSAISLAGALTNRLGERFALSAVLATGETLSVNEFSLEDRYTPTLSVTGNVPCQLLPGRAEGWLVWDAAAAIALAGNWEDRQSQRILLPLGTREELEVSKPQLQLQVSGTPEHPLGSLTVTAGTIGWLADTNQSPRPRLEDLRLRAEIQPDAIKLVGFDAQLDGQPIQATGAWPLPAGTWRAMWSQRKWPDWAQAHGRLRANEAQMAALARYLPQVVAPEGRLTVELELKAGRQFIGFLSLTNAATHAFGNLTPIRDVAAQVRLAGQRAVLEKCDGQIGGQPIRATGFATLPIEGALEYQLDLRGTNVPVARSLELLLRSDFDLHLRRQRNEPPVLSGGLKLHDGLYLQHAGALVWSGPKRPELRPPYFSFTNPPLADVRLDLSISGDRFLRARTPLFNGQFSTALKLGGTLRDPVITGDVRVNSGRVVFPFGTLNVDQGFASFSGNDPRGPELQVAASGRNYRYDVRLDVKGPANGAQVTFASTPPLTSEQVLLMLTAGELPQTDFAFSSTARAGRLASFLGKDLFSRFLGGERAEERLILRTGESISEEGRLTYSVEYKLTDRWSIIGEYDEYNAFNADLKWKILTR